MASRRDEIRVYLLTFVCGSNLSLNSVDFNCFGVAEVGLSEKTHYGKGTRYKTKRRLSPCLFRLSDFLVFTSISCVSTQLVREGWLGSHTTGSAGLVYIGPTHRDCEGP